MASAAQIAANRRNAAKSTGPKTARGKAAVGRNALRHGLTAARTLCFDETEAAFAAFAQGLRAALAPADPLEAQLADEIVLCAWRSRRAGRIEPVLFRVFDRPEPRLPVTDGGEVLAQATKEMNALSRYEAALDRALYEAHCALERRQAERGGASYETKPIIPVESAAGAETKPSRRRRDHERATKPPRSGRPIPSH